MRLQKRVQICSIVLFDLVPSCQVSRCQVSRFQRPHSELHTEGALTLKAFADSANASQGSDINNLFDDIKVHGGVRSWIRFDR